MRVSRHKNKLLFYFLLLTLLAIPITALADDDDDKDDDYDVKARVVRIQGRQGFALRPRQQPGNHGAPLRVQLAAQARPVELRRLQEVRMHTPHGR